MEVVNPDGEQEFRDRLIDRFTSYDLLESLVDQYDLDVITIIELFWDDYISSNNELMKEVGLSDAF